jgi:hypothetical protein
MNLLFLERKALERAIFSPDLLKPADGPPHRRRTHSRNISGGHEQMRREFPAGMRDDGGPALLS